ncbi:MAG: hypothetical protein J6T10_30850 [Methanobrevibacter sp.]|nr:hypothetical protein [Methanobrevibacter sp.]
MTKRHLRTWVKVVFLIIVLFGYFYFNYKLSANAVSDCIAKGQSEEVCDELWK